MQGRRSGWPAADCGESIRWSHRRNVRHHRHLLQRRMHRRPGSTDPDLPTDGFRKATGLNVVGVFFGLKLVIPVMAKTGRGRIISSFSVAGLTGSLGLDRAVA